MRTCSMVIYEKARLPLILGVFVYSAMFSVAQTSPSSITEERISNSSESFTLLKSGDVAYYAGDYRKAVEDFKKGLDLLTPGSRTQVLRAELADRFATAASQEAQRLTKDGKLNEAKQLLEDALSKDVAPTNQAAQRALDHLNDPIRTNPSLTPEHVSNVDKVRRLLYKGDGAYNLGKFDEAKSFFEKVLKIDPYNKAARRGMERVNQRQASYYQSSYDSTRARMLAEVDKAWKLPDGQASGQEGSEIVTSFSISNAATLSDVTEKLETLVIPVVDLEDVDIFEVADFLRAQSRSADNLNFDEASKGVQFVLNISEGSKVIDKRLTLNLSNVPLKNIVDTIASSFGVNVKIDNFAVVLADYAVSDASLISRTFNVSPDFLSRSSVNKGEATDDPFAVSDDSSDSLLGVRVSAQQFLENMGISFEGGATAAFLPSSSTLIVKNTQEQLDAVTNIVDALAKEQPANIMLEVRLISIEQSNDEDLSTDWTIQGTILDAVQDGIAIAGGSVGTGKENEGITGRPLTAGNRSGDLGRSFNSIDQVMDRQLGSPGRVFASYDPFVLANTGNLNQALLNGIVTDPGSSTLVADASPAPGILSVEAALNTSTVQAMLRGLSQKKGTDFMVKPSVTTRSGQLTSIQIGKEFQYATEYEPPEISEGSANDFDSGDTDDNDVNIGDRTWSVTFEEDSRRIVELEANGRTYKSYSVAVTPSHPTAFEKVLIGTDLEIEPTLGKDKKTIDLSIRNTYKDFDGYINYGNPINTVANSINFSDDFIANNPGFFPSGEELDESGGGGAGAETYVTVFGTDNFPPGPGFGLGDIVINQRFFQATPNYILMPVFQTINAQTNVTVYDGATLVLGGMIQSTRLKGEDGTPFLSKIPLIGNAFRSEFTETINKQVIITVTAKVVDPTGRPLNTQF